MTSGDILLPFQVAMGDSGDINRWIDASVAVGAEAIAAWMQALNQASSMALQQGVAAETIRPGSGGTVATAMTGEEIVEQYRSLWVESEKSADRNKEPIKLDLAKAERVLRAVEELIHVMDTREARSLEEDISASVFPNNPGVSVEASRLENILMAIRQQLREEIFGREQKSERSDFAASADSGNFVVDEGTSEIAQSLGKESNGDWNAQSISLKDIGNEPVFAESKEETKLPNEMEQTAVEPRNLPQTRVIHQGDSERQSEDVFDGLGGADRNAADLLGRGRGESGWSRVEKEVAEIVDFSAVSHREEQVLPRPEKAADLSGRGRGESGWSRVEKEVAEVVDFAEAPRLEEQVSPRLERPVISSPGISANSGHSERSELIAKPVSVNLPERLESFRVVQQVSRGIVVSLSRGEGRAILRLDPPELGHVDLEVEYKPGEMKVRLTVENQAVKELLDTQISHLRDSLDRQQIQLQKLEVAVEQKSVDARHQAWEEGSPGSGKRNHAHKKNRGMKFAEISFWTETASMDTGRRLGYNTMEVIA